MRIFPLVGLSALAMSLPAQAATPLSALRLTPDIAIALGTGDTLVSTGEVARHDLSSGVAGAVVIADLPAGADVVGYHYRQGGHYLVFGTTVMLDGVTFTPRDVAYTDGGGTWSKYFDGAGAGIPDGVAVDAVAIGTDAYLRLSFDTTVTLGGMVYDPRDVARYAVGTFAMSEALSTQIPAGLDVVGLDVLPNGHWLVAMDGSGSVGGVSFDDEDVLEYTAPATWEMAYDGSVHDADWTGAGIAALAGEMAPGILATPASGLTTTESGGSATFAIRLLTPPTADVTVALSSSDPTEGSVAPASLTFTPLDWALGQTVTVTGADDAQLDGDIAYAIQSLAASADAGYDGLSGADVGVTNQDDEAVGPGSLRFTVSSQSVSEGVGNVSVTVSRVGGTAGAISVGYSNFAGSAAKPADFAHAFGTLYWADGDAADKNFTIAIVDDAVVEGDETFTVTLTDPEGGATLGTPASQTVTLQDNDVAAVPGSLRFTVASQSVSEGAGTVSVTVSRVGGSDGAVSVGYSNFAGTAAKPADFANAFGTLYWADGDAADKSFTIAIVDDAAVEGDETFSVTLTDPEGGATLGTPASQIVTLQDNDAVAVPGSLRFTVASQSVSEGAGTLVVSVSRVGGSDGAVGVDYAATPGSATAPADFALASGTLNWGDGDSADKTFTVVLQDDAVMEGPESFALVLSAPTGGAALGAPASQTVILADDDVASVAPVPGLGPLALILLVALLGVLSWRERTCRAS